MHSRLADELSTIRHELFVGREDQLQSFRTELTSESRSFYVLHVTGPGGVGKTALLDEYSRICSETNSESYRFDARDWDASPDQILEILRRRFGLVEDRSIFDWLSERGRVVLLIDTCEHLAHLDAWIREWFVPALPTNVLLVLCGRDEPSKPWQSDAALQTISRTTRLRNLNQTDSREYLRRRGIPADAMDEIVAFSYGHPLALAVIAEGYQRDIPLPFDDNRAGDVIPILFERIMRQVLHPLQRQAVQATSLVRRLDISILEHMLEIEDGYDLYSWLQSRSFTERGGDGLFVHDLIRDVVVSNMMRNDPEWHHTLHRRARGYYNEQLKRESASHETVLTEYIFLHRMNPTVRTFFVQLKSDYSTGAWYHQAYTKADEKAVLAMVEEHEGTESARLARKWSRSGAATSLVYRDGSHDVVGIFMRIALDQVTASERRSDPAIDAAMSYLEAHAPLRPGETATYFRYWMARDTYQDISPVQSLIFVEMVKHYLTQERLAFTFLPCANPEPWAVLFAYADIQRIPEADYSFEGQAPGLFGHDWRTVPPTQWLDSLAGKEIGESDESAPSGSRARVYLSKDDFHESVREALKQFHRPHELMKNPLLKSRCIETDLDDASAAADRIGLLQSIIETAAGELKASSKQARYYDAVAAAYLTPERTQEKAAEEVGVPFSTFRRHMNRGANLIAERLWLREIGG